MNKRLRKVTKTDPTPSASDRLYPESSNDALNGETVTEKKGTELASYIDDITETVKIGLDQSIAILTPWFFNNMPKIYYQTTPRVEKIRHLSAIITGHVFETKQTVELWDRARAKVTYIGPGSDRKILIDMATKIKPLEIKLGSLYFSRDKILFLSTFFRKDFVKADLGNKHIITKVAAARKQILASYTTNKEEVETYLNNLDHDFVTYSTVKRLVVSFKMVLHMLSHEGAHTFLNISEGTPIARLTLGLKGVNISELLDNVLHLIDRYEFNLVRSFVAQFDKGYVEPISVLHFVISHKSLESINPQTVSVIKLIKALRTLGWVDSDGYTSLTQEPYLLSINGANFIRGVASWIHIILGKENSYYYSEHKISQTFHTHAKLTDELILLFKLKFSPLREEGRRQNGYKKAREELVGKIEEIIDKIERTIFLEGVNFVDHVLKSNYFLPTKTGLAFRLDTSILDPVYYPNKPFGIFFIAGRDYRFFQVRWKDISRGGLRVVMPRNAADHGFALAGLFDEVYGLSQAQQMKNKDIPEGGSKAVMVLRPGGNRDRAVRGAINALLDLLVPEDESHEEKASKQVSYYKEEEIIYLGPDENLTNDLIVWITAQARRRGYKYANAFMSSKPAAGINHKEYGVTSQGLNVFVEQMLAFLGIDPKKQKFTVKMTGGPDGDVAGNELKILHSEYGENARIIAVADGHGAAFDPAGLDWQELLSLVNRDLSIAHFNGDKLAKGKGAYVIKADTAENIRKRNELHAVAKADIFIPAGGRPYTVNDTNYTKLISSDGKPSCRAIVEGANIFFTKMARQKLQEAGIYIIKDSSANKTGVICSSFEIIASLLLSDEEFLKIKQVYVQQVITILKQKAGMEAKMLFALYQSFKGQKTLVELSEEISAAINRVTDTLLERLVPDRDKVLAAPLFQSIIIKHCPPILVEKYRDRILNNLPVPHKIAILAAYIASYVVYNEGLGWVDAMSDEQRYQTVLSYMNSVENAERLISMVENSDLEQRDLVASILRRSAARDLTIFSLEKRPGKGS